MQKIREHLALILVAVLPFHAFLVTVFTKVIAGPGQAPLGALVLWKEAVLGVVMMIAVWEIAKKRTVDSGQRTRKFDGIDALIIILIVLSLIVTAMTHGDWRLYLFGFKYDFIPLVAFVVLRRASWSAWFQSRAESTLLGIGVVVSVYGILSVFLPPAFFRWLGYSDLHSLYIPGGPLAAFQQIGGSAIRRIQSVMSGPNQLGLWLLIPWSVAVVSLVRGGVVRGQRSEVGKRWSMVGLLIIGAALLLTFSRSAWIGAFVIVVAAAGSVLPKKVFWTMAGAASVLMVIASIAISLLFPSIFLRIASSRDHYLRPLEAIQSMAHYPLGQGLGTAGPASNRISDACVFLDIGADATWAQDHPALCVFVGETQVQPVDGTCDCPVIPENWYLQIGVEMGVLGFLLYFALMGLLCRKLWRGSQRSEVSGQKKGLITDHGFPTALLFFIGISIAALFLHAWEDSAVAYTIWVLIACSVSRFRDGKKIG